jgi:hypothetical protein
MFLTSGMVMTLISYTMLVFLWLTYLAEQNRLSPLVKVLSALRLVLASPHGCVAPNCSNGTPMMPYPLLGSLWCILAGIWGAPPWDLLGGGRNREHPRRLRIASMLSPAARH